MDDDLVSHRTDTPGMKEQTREEFLKRAGAVTAALAAGSALTGVARASGARYNRNLRAKVSGSINVRYWGQGPERIAWDNRIKYFASKYPNVKVNSQLLQKNGYDEFPALLTQIAAGHAPDVIRVLNFQPAQLVAQGKALMPLDDFIKNDKTLNVPDFVAVAWKAGFVNGKMYAIPQNGEPYNVHYNQDAFAKAGLTDPWVLYKAGKWNQDAFRSAAKALQQKAGQKFGAAWESWNYDVFVFMAGGAVLNKAHSPAIQQQPAPKVLQFFSDMINKDKTAPDPNVPSGNWLQYFTQGQLGMYLSGSWWAKYMPKVPFKWASAPLPSCWGHLGSKLENDALSISAQTKNPEAAWAFVRTITDTKAEVIWSAIATPTRKSSLKSPIFLSNPHVKATLVMLDHSTFTPFTKVGQAVDTACITAFDPMWLGKETATAATANAAKALKKALA
jgi:ABC-type glycerol-3-phosphate transport system substrate-binding protein